MSVNIVIAKAVTMHLYMLQNINSAFFCSALSTCISVLPVKINSLRTVTTHLFNYSFMC